MAAVFFYLVYKLTAAVVSPLAAVVFTLGGIPLAVFIGQAGTKRAQNIIAYEIFACDKLNVFLLTLFFLFYKLKNDGLYFKRPLIT